MTREFCNIITELGKIIMELRYIITELRNKNAYYALVTEVLRRLRMCYAGVTEVTEVS